MLKLILQSVLAALIIPYQIAMAAQTADLVSTNKNAPAVYTEDKQNIMVTVDQPQFILKLKSNLTTGYAWFLREYDANLITPIKHSFQKPTDKTLMGAPGFELWTFQMKPAAFAVPQQTIIRLIYTRPWQRADNSTQSVFTVTTETK